MDTLGANLFKREYTTWSKAATLLGMLVWKPEQPVQTDRLTPYNQPFAAIAFQ